MPHTPQQNGVDERKNKTLVQIARCLLQAKDVSMKLWDKFIYYENYILKQIPIMVFYHVTLSRSGLVRNPLLVTK